MVLAPAMPRCGCGVPSQEMVQGKIKVPLVGQDKVEGTAAVSREFNYLVEVENVLEVLGVCHYVKYPQLTDFADGYLVFILSAFWMRCCSNWCLAGLCGEDNTQQMLERARREVMVGVALTHSASTPSRM